MLAGEEASLARFAVTQQSTRYGDLYGDQSMKLAGLSEADQVVFIGRPCWT